MPSSNHDEQSPSKVIELHTEYLHALARIDRLFNSRRGTPQGVALELLLSQVEAYEKTAFPIEPPHPTEALRFRSEQEQSE
jgi:HTH-type transcriptional regulator/antitoxin HigA